MEEAPRAALQKVRSVCLALPGVTETTSYGHPTGKAGRKTFAVFERYRGDWSVALKAEPDQQRALIGSDARFYRTPYIGQLGWVSLKLQGRIPWKLLRGPLREAHSSVA
jgi:predicted DNA-binding protein (MmcQ/YjbR family)